MEEPAKKKSLGWLGIAAIALGGSNLSIVVIATLLSQQGTFAIPLLCFGMIVAIMAAPGYIELVLMYPNKVGGITAACLDAFRPYNPVLANITGTCYWFAWVPAISFAAGYAATVIQQIWLPGLSTSVISTGLIVGITLFTFAGMYWVQRLVIPVAAAGATLALLSCLIPVITGHVNWDQATNFNLKVVFPGLFGQLSSAMAGLYLVGWVAPAVENSLCYVGETKKPQKNTPRALYACLLVGVLYFIICPVIWLGVLGPQSLMKDILGQELWVTYAPVLGPMANMAAAWFMIFNMLVCIVAPLVGPPRTIAQLAKDGLLPAFIGATSRLEVPWVATIITSVASIIIVWLGAPTWLIAATNFDYVVAISLSSMAVWLLRKDAPDAIRLYRAPKGFITLSLISAMIWVLTTVLGFQQYSILTVLTGIICSFLGVFLYLIRKGNDRIKEKKSFIPTSLHLRLTGVMVTVLLIDAIGYLFALQNIALEHPALNAILEDIFITVALLTLSVGLVVPGMITYAATEVNQAAAHLLKGPLASFTKAMRALGSGDLEAAYVDEKIQPVPIHSQDEIGQMAVSFNEMQNEIKESMLGLNAAREGLILARHKLKEANSALHELNMNLEARVDERTKELEDINLRLIQEISERKRVEEQASILTKQLIESARHAGMADIATNVLHNIGNVLNSVNVSSEVIHERVSQTRYKSLTKLVSLINEHKNDLATFFTENKQGINALKYLNLFSVSLEDESRFILEEAQFLGKNVQHIKDVVSAQQSLAISKSMIEPIDLKSLLGDAVSLHKLLCERDHINVTFYYDEIKPVIIDKIKLLQILDNLIKNGIESLIESSTSQKELHIRTTKQDSHYFKIEISDNGLGVSEDNAVQIFSHGFTTKKTGHGFGLHSSANFASEMGGSLSVVSEGLGKGATFILILPLNSNKAPSTYPHDMDLMER